MNKSNKSASGYMHPVYAESLAEFGTPRELPRSGGWVLKRQIPDFSYHDGLWCYPLFCCQNWTQLYADLEGIGTELVSLSLVTNPFGEYEPAYLHQCFDGCFSLPTVGRENAEGFLVWKAVPFEKVHSLNYLLDMCEVVEHGWAPLREGAETLAPYAVEIRYPGELLQVSLEETRDALTVAEAVRDFILNLLPHELSSSLSVEGS